MKEIELQQLVFEEHLNLRSLPLQVVGERVEYGAPIYIVATKVSCGHPLLLYWLVSSGTSMFQVAASIPLSECSLRLLDMFYLKWKVHTKKTEEKKKTLKPLFTMLGNICIKKKH